jgi:hypothetical protein
MPVTYKHTTDVGLSADFIPYFLCRFLPRKYEYTAGYLKLSRRSNAIKSSRRIGRLRMELQSNVSFSTISVDIYPDDGGRDSLRNVVL